MFLMEKEKPLVGGSGTFFHRVVGHPHCLKESYDFFARSWHRAYSYLAPWLVWWPSPQNESFPSFVCCSPIPIFDFSITRVLVWLLYPFLCWHFKSIPTLLFFYPDSFIRLFFSESFYNYLIFWLKFLTATHLLTLKRELRVFVVMTQVSVTTSILRYNIKIHWCFHI